MGRLPRSILTRMVPLPPPPAPVARVRLCHTDPARWRLLRAVSVAVFVLLLALDVTVGVLVAVAFVSLTRSTDSAIVGFVFLPIAFLVMFGAFVWMRRADFLEGTTYVQGTAFRTKRVDLATAEAWLETNPAAGVGWQVSRAFGDQLALGVRDALSGTVLWICVRAGSRTMPARELMLIADALLAAPRVAGRDRVHALAATLRELAEPMPRHA